LSQKLFQQAFYRIANTKIHIPGVGVVLPLIVSAMVNKGNRRANLQLLLKSGTIKGDKYQPGILPTVYSYVISRKENAK
jgi:hypothetical protein